MPEPLENAATAAAIVRARCHTEWRSESWRAVLFFLFGLACALTGTDVTCVAAADEADYAAGPMSSLVIIGGGLDARNTSVFEHVLGARLDRAPICIVPFASDDPDEATKYTLGAIENYGGPGSALAPIVKGQANDPAVAAALRSCGGFWFTGGDQVRIVDELRPGRGTTPAHAAILDVIRRGGVVAGTSAGAAMVSDPMIADGDPEDALRLGVVDRPNVKGVYVRDGMGFVKGVLFDQHFLARGRIARLLTVLDAKPEIRVAIGIDENTAVLLKNGVAEVLGASSIVVLDAQTAGGYRMQVLGAGDRLDLATLAVTPAADKTALPTGPRRVRAPRRPWKDDAFATFLGRFAAARATEATMPGVRPIRLAKAGNFRALARTGKGPHDMPTSLFAGPFTITIAAAPAAGGTK